MKKNSSLFIVIIAILLYSCSDYIEQSHNSLNFLSDNDASWIPFFLMDNEVIKNQVQDIYECHDLDTNESWGYFSIINKNLIFDCIYFNREDFFQNNTREIKRLKKIGYTESSNEFGKINGNEFSYVLFYDEKKQKFYFYGK